MDMLAEACVQENSAAQILSSMLGQQRQGAPTPPPREGRLTPLPSPGSSEDTAATHAYTRPWMRAEDDHLRQLAASKALPSPGSRRYAATGELDSHIWEEIARSFDARTPSQCAHRYQVLCMATLSATLTCSKPGSLAAIQPSHRLKAMAHCIPGIHSWRCGDLPHLAKLGAICLD